MVLVAGVDEAGRGPIAGPVVVAAVILGPTPIAGLADSKRLRPKIRECLANIIRSEALAWSLVLADEAEIEAKNILQATLAAMKRAVEGLDPPPDEVIVDGPLSIPGLRFPQRAVVDADASCPVVSAASILAKTYRDEYMRLLDAEYPQYGFATHKGYATRQHLEALREHGPCPAHRIGFAPVRAAMTATTDWKLRFEDSDSRI